MKLAFCYVSCLKDLCWLSYSLQFLRRNWRELGTKIVVRIEEDCLPIVKTWEIPNVEYIVIDKWPNGYHRHLHAKLVADEHSDADLIFLIDSDVMLFRPCWLDDLIDEHGRVIIEYLPWSESRVAERYWRWNSQKALGLDIDNDYMIRQPFGVWRGTFGAVRAQIEKTTGTDLRSYMYTEVPFSHANFASHPFPLADYEVLNAYALTREPDRYVAKDARQRQGQWMFRLYWSHGDWSPETQADLDRRLKV